MARDRTCPACFLGASMMETYHNLKLRKELTNIGPEATSKATVLSRRVSNVTTISRAKTSWLYLVTFRLESGEEKELLVGEMQYASFPEGKHVTITWQEDKLISFTEA